MNTTERALRRRPAWISGRGARVSALLSAVVLVGAGTAVASGTTTIRSAGNKKLGRILVGPARYTLYVWVGGTNSVGTAHSSRKFPAMVASGPLVAARGSQVKSGRLGTRKLSGGRRQVTYYGEPLYLYKGEPKPGTTKGENKFSGNGAYFVISTGGRPVYRPGY